VSSDFRGSTLAGYRAPSGRWWPVLQSTGMDAVVWTTNGLLGLPSPNRSAASSISVQGSMRSGRLSTPRWTLMALASTLRMPPSGLRGRDLTAAIQAQSDCTYVQGATILAKAATRLPEARRAAAFDPSYAEQAKRLAARQRLLRSTVLWVLRAMPLLV
jgi:hypothetical protein